MPASSGAIAGRLGQPGHFPLMAAVGLIVDWEQVVTGADTTDLSITFSSLSEKGLSPLHLGDDDTFGFIRKQRKRIRTSKTLEVLITIGCAHSGQLSLIIPETA